MADNPTSASNLPELSVSEISGAVKRTIETQFDRVRVRGELGRVTRAKSGHMYFDLKDDKAVLHAVMWKGQTAHLSFRPEEGLEVVAEGKLTTFPGKSEYQMVCDKLEPAGAGALLAMLEERKKKLAAEGLFAADRKRKLPFLPEVIGIVTSPTGAVIRDILHRLAERFPVRVILWPAVVQGPTAQAQIVAGIEGLNLLPHGDIPRPDVIIVARGGGSIEDLWCFNEEAVVRAAAASQIPLISAVGHETDTTLIDFASDLRAPTPTAAAEFAVPVRAELATRLSTLGGRQKQALVRTLENAKTELRAAAAALPKPEALLQIATQRFDRAAERLEAALAQNARKHEAALLRVGARLQPGLVARDLSRRNERTKDLGLRARAALSRRVQRLDEQSALAGRRLAARSPLSRIAPLEAQLELSGARLHQAMRRSWGDKRKALRSVTQLLQTLDHKSVLSRGYALVWRANATLAKRAEILSPGETISLEFADSRRLATIAGGPGGGTSIGPTYPAPEAHSATPSSSLGVSEGPKAAPFKKNGKKGGDGGGQTSLF